MEFIGFLALVALLVIVLRMRSRLSLLEATVNRLAAVIPPAPAISAAPVIGAQQADTPRAAPTIPAPVAAQPAEAERVAAEPAAETAGPAAGTQSAPTPLREYGDFERRFGTQWVVWIGGLALALGGIFLVRYTIEAGLIGPGMRITLGGLLALALVGLGEFTRRREVLAGFARFNSAHIPSVLTAAGTTVAYAVIYAAFALYNFLSPGAAFLLLGVVALATLAAALLHGPALAGARSGRRLRDASPDRVDATELLGAVSLSHRGHRRRLHARARADVALARDHRCGVLSDLAGVAARCRRRNASANGLPAGRLCACIGADRQWLSIRT